MSLDDAEVLDYSQVFARIWEREEEELARSGSRRVGLFEVMAILDEWQKLGTVQQQMDEHGGIVYTVDGHPELGALHVVMY